MSGLLFLKAADFFIGKGVQGKILCHNIPSFSLILFYSTKCGHCHELIPIFKSLPGTINNCQFGMINVSSREGRPVLGMGKDTIAPIEFVPFILLYVNGRPFIRYNSSRDENTIRRFVVETAKKIRERQPFTPNDNIKHPKQGKGIPEYSLGSPLCGKDRVCYLTEMDLQERENDAKQQEKKAVSTERPN
jgi:hypothetical protein